MARVLNVFTFPLPTQNFRGVLFSKSAALQIHGGDPANMSRLKYSCEFVISALDVSAFPCHPHPSFPPSKVQDVEGEREALIVFPTFLSWFEVETGCGRSSSKRGSFFSSNYVW